MSRWLSIDSAPKDGSRVLAWRKDWTQPCFVRWIRNPRTETEFWNDAEELDYYENETEPPTHWIPLPEPTGEGHGMSIGDYLLEPGFQRDDSFRIALAKPETWVCCYCGKDSGSGVLPEDWNLADWHKKRDSKGFCFGCYRRAQNIPENRFGIVVRERLRDGCFKEQKSPTASEYIDEVKRSFAEHARTSGGRMTERQYVCEYCHNVWYADYQPKGWHMVIGGCVVCPDCHDRVQKEGGYTIVKCGSYAQGRPDPRAKDGIYDKE